MLKVQNVSAGYSKKIPIIGNVSLNLTEGKIIGIIGKNGCGKSTLLKAILGLAPYKTGKVYLYNNDISESTSDYISKYGLIGYLPQRHRIFPNLTVYENVLIPYFGKGNIKRKDVDQIFTREIFEDLLDFKNTSASYLSGGQSLLLAIACLILFNPPVFILDEPSDGLDFNKKNKLIELLNELREQKKGIIMVEQNIEILKELNADMYLIEDLYY